MQHTFFREAAITLALFGSISFAIAQNTAQPEPANPQPAPPNQTKKDPVPPATDKSEETRAGTTEPSSKIQGTAATTSILVNGALAVAGAPPDVDTIPAKFSARTAADDAVPIVGYVLRHVTDEQRRTIFQSVDTKKGPQPERASADYAMLGALVPTSVALEGLRPLPQNVVTSLPEMRDVMFTIAGDKLLLVNPRTRVVIGVLGP